MIKIQDLKIDISCFGKHKILADVRPYYAYSGNNNKDIEGFKYKVVLPALKMEALEVKIPGAKQYDLKEDGKFPNVEFDDLVARVYVIDGRPVISATAKGIHAVNNDKA